MSERDLSIWWSYIINLKFFDVGSWETIVIVRPFQLFNCSSIDNILHIWIHVSPYTGKISVCLFYHEHIWNMRLGKSYLQDTIQVHCLCGLSDLSIDRGWPSVTLLFPRWHWRPAKIYTSSLSSSLLLSSLIFSPFPLSNYYSLMAVWKLNKSWYEIPLDRKYHENSTQFYFLRFQKNTMVNEKWIWVWKYH